MRIIHFAVDDKFIPFIQQIFEEAYPGQNSFRISGKHNEHAKFVLPIGDVRIVDDTYWFGSTVVKELQKYDILVVHFLTPQFIQGILKCPKDLLIVWVPWGGEYFHLFEPFVGRLVLDETYKMIQDIPNKEQEKKEIFYQKLWRFLRKPKTFLASLKRRMFCSSIEDIIKRIDIVSISPSEQHLFRSALPEFSGKFHIVFPYSVEDIFSVGSFQMDGPDILVGNSATPENNHLELFQMLTKVDLSGRRLIAPLNYGWKEYGDEIEKVGKSIFGQRFIALRCFMPLSEYNSLLSQCGTLIFNHVRQQGATTIATGLYKGAKIFLREENTVYSFYKDMGLSIFTVQHDFIQGNVQFGPLPIDLAFRQKRIISDYWSHKNALKSIHRLAGFLREKRCNSGFLPK